MKLQYGIFLVLLSASAPIFAQQQAVNAEQLIEDGKFTDAAVEYANRINLNAGAGNPKALSDACIGLYKVLWLNQAQDKVAHLFKPCSSETMDWLKGNVDRDYQLIRRVPVFHKDILYLAKKNEINISFLVDIDANGLPKNIRISEINPSIKTNTLAFRDIQKALFNQIMAWRWLPRMEGKLAVEAKDYSFETALSRVRR